MNNKKYRIKTPILLAIGIGIVFSTTLNSNNCYAATLIEALQEYCVPKDGLCTNKATYGQYKTSTGATSTCACSTCNSYYDKESRSCKQCESGTYVTTQYETSCITATCPDGYTATVVKGKSVCPDGYYTKAVLSSCN